MPKRKRDHHAAHQRVTLSDRVSASRSVEVEKKLVHGKKRLNHALKLAKGFERQKLAKRIGKIRGTELEKEDVGRLEREVEVLKGLDLPVLAQHHLHKTIRKIKDIASAESLPSYVLEEPTKTSEDGETASARHNVTARLYNAKHVKTEMASIVASIRDALGLDQARRPGKNVTLTIEEEAPTSHQANGVDQDLDDLDDINDKSSFEGFPSADEDQHSEVNGAEAASSDEDESFSHFDGRIASSESESDDEESNHLGRPVTSNLSQSTYDPSADRSLSPSPSTVSSVTPPPSNARPPKPTSKPSAAPSSTTFLPSLMTGYWSGGSSEASEDDLDDGAATRKNRMGQRARRQLWEKKFGKGANHIKKGQTGTRDDGWDTRKGARAGDERGGHGRGRRGGRDGMSGRGRVRAEGPTGLGSGSNAVEVASTSRAEKERKEKAANAPLHPSWEAARKAKEAKKAAPFQGKKTVFD
ncbi:MAG: hypothetical protein M1817_000433 [Caeruleum heppii]|nr:MAG: hypothetical protein M1817_000433 [Caeruleum heppii]